MGAAGGSSRGRSTGCAARPRRALRRRRDRRPPPASAAVELARRSARCRARQSPRSSRTRRSSATFIARQPRAAARPSHCAARAGGEARGVRARRVGHVARRARARARAHRRAGPGRPGATTSPLRPAVTYSGMPPESVTTAGVPAASASAATVPNGSRATARRARRTTASARARRRPARSAITVSPRLARSSSARRSYSRIRLERRGRARSRRAGRHARRQRREPRRAGRARPCAARSARRSRPPGSRPPMPAAARPRPPRTGPGGCARDRPAHPIARRRVPTASDAHATMRTVRQKLATAPWPRRVLEQVVQVQHRAASAPSAGTSRCGTTPFSQTTSGRSAADRARVPRPREHRPRPAAAPQRAERQLVDAGSPSSRARARDAALGRHGELELDALGRESGGQPQQRAARRRRAQPPARPRVRVAPWRHDARMASRYDDELWELVPDRTPRPTAGICRTGSRSLEPARHALDLGCGDGALSAAVRADRLTLADVSPVALGARARTPAGGRGGRARRRTRRCRSPTGRSTWWCARRRSSTCATSSCFLSEVRRVLEPGGRLALTTPANRRLISRHRDPLSPHLRFFTKRSLRRAARADGLRRPGAAPERRRAVRGRAR